MVFTKLLLENNLAVRPYNYEASSELHLPKVPLCIPVHSSRYIGKCAARVLMLSNFSFTPHPPSASPVPKKPVLIGSYPSYVGRSV